MPAKDNRPANVTVSVNAKNGRTYYGYRHPITGQHHGLGTDKQRAYAAARQLNERLVGADPLVNKVLGEITVERARSSFEAEYLPEREYADSTRYDHERYIRRFAKYRGDHPVRSLTVRDFATYLDALPPRASNAHRSTLLHFMRHCRAKGWIDWNPAEATIPRLEKVQRQRLTVSAYKQIWMAASVEIKNAMDMSLKTLQGRSEIARMKFEDYVGHSRKLRVIRRKTKKASVKRYLRGEEPVAYIEIHADDELHAIIGKCRDDIASAYMIHNHSSHKDRRARGLSPESISRGFARARNATGLFDDWPPEQKPTFHEVRSLGSDLLRKKGWTEEQLQRLLGHTSVTMTKRYLEGHEIPFVEVIL